MFGNLVYVATGPSVKITALLMYQRIFIVPRFRILTISLCIVCVLWYVAEVFGSIWNCVPINGFWNKSIKAKCISTKAFDLQYAIINIVLDIIILALPIRMVSGLHLTRSSKIGLMLLFLMGGLSVLSLQFKRQVEFK